MQGGIASSSSNVSAASSVSSECPGGEHPFWGPKFNKWRALVVPLSLKEMGLPLKCGRVNTATAGQHALALNCVWPAKDGRGFKRALELLRGGEFDYLQCKGPVEYSFGVETGDGVRLDICKEKPGCFGLLFVEGVLLPYSRRTRHPGCSEQPPSANSDCAVLVSGAAARPPVEQAKMGQLDLWVTEAITWDRRHNLWSIGWKEMKFLPDEATGVWPMIPMCPGSLEPIVIDLDPILDPEAEKWVNDGWGLVLSGTMPKPQSDDWEVVSDSSEFECPDFDDLVSVSVSKGEASDCLQEEVVPTDVDSANGLRVRVAVGQEAPPHTVMDPRSLWIGGNTEETSYAPMLEVEELSMWAKFNLWCGRWKGCLVECRPEVLRGVPIREGIWLYSRVRQAGVAVDRKFIGGVLDMDTVQSIVCSDAAFELVERLVVELPDGRRYQLARLEKVVDDTLWKSPVKRVQDWFYDRLALRFHTFSRVALRPREEVDLLLGSLSSLPTGTAKVRCMFNLLAPALPAELQGVFRDIRSEQLPLENLEAFEPLHEARQLCALQGAVERMSGKKTQFSVK